VAPDHRLRRRQGPRDEEVRRTYTYFVPDVAYHLAKWNAATSARSTSRATDHHGTIARVRAGLQAANVGIPEAIPTTCCTR